MSPSEIPVPNPSKFRPQFSRASSWPGHLPANNQGEAGELLQVSQLDGEPHLLASRGGEELLLANKEAEEVPEVSQHPEEASSPREAVASPLRRAVELSQPGEEVRERNIRDLRSPHQDCPQEPRQPSSQQAEEPSPPSEAEVRQDLHLLEAGEELHHSREVGELQQGSQAGEEPLQPEELQEGEEAQLPGELRQAGEDRHLEPSRAREIPW